MGTVIYSAMSACEVRDTGLHGTGTGDITSSHVKRSHVIHHSSPGNVKNSPLWFAGVGDTQPSVNVSSRGYGIRSPPEKQNLQYTVAAGITRAVPSGGCEPYHRPVSEYDPSRHPGAWAAQPASEPEQMPAASLVDGRAAYEHQHQAAQSPQPSPSYHSAQCSPQALPAIVPFPRDAGLGPDRTQDELKQELEWYTQQAMQLRHAWEHTPGMDSPAKTQAERTYRAKLEEAVDEIDSVCHRVKLALSDKAAAMVTGGWGDSNEAASPVAGGASPRRPSSPMDTWKDSLRHSSGLRADGNTSALCDHSRPQGW